MAHACPKAELPLFVKDEVGASRQTDFTQTPCAHRKGFSLNAAVCCGADDFQALAHLRRDITLAQAGIALALGDHDATPCLLNHLVLLCFGADRSGEAPPPQVRLAASTELTLRCRAWANRVARHPRQGRADKARAAVDDGLAAQPGTQVDGAQAIVPEALPLHGDAADLPRTRPWLRDRPLDSQRPQRMARALARHGLSV